MTAPDDLAAALERLRGRSTDGDPAFTASDWYALSEVLAHVAALESELDATEQRNTDMVAELAKTMQRCLAAEARAKRALDEVAWLRASIPCRVARPHERTYECRHDRLCDGCELRGQRYEAERSGES